MNKEALLEKLNRQKQLTIEEWQILIEQRDGELAEKAQKLAQAIAIENFGKHVFFRGIVEFTNICKNDCFYCGIRRSNTAVSRYRLTKEEILTSCREGYDLGFRTFVLQGGEDAYFTDEVLCDLVGTIRKEFSDCAITLSVGERSKESYQSLYQAGANRYLLRHETANQAHYQQLHPQEMSWERRIACLNDLKEIGFQTGCGCMVGAPYQTSRHLAEDMYYMCEFKPQMIGMGPFISHKDTPFKDFASGSSALTLYLLSLARIALPKVLLPATTALGTIDGDGRKLGVLHGCNVIMPNLSPKSVRKKYMLYDNKAGGEYTTEQSLAEVRAQVESIGYQLISVRGDYQE